MFTIVNITVLVLRKQPVEHKHFRVPTIFPIIGALTCGFLVTPFADRPAVQYQIAGVLLGIGVVLWSGTVLVNKRLGKGGPRIDPEKLAEHE